MADEESLRQVAHSPAPFSTWLGILILFLFFGVVVLALVGPAARSDTYEKTRAEKRAGNLKTLREEDKKALAVYSWVNKDKKIARIPIEQAMKLTVTELSQKKPAPAGPIATPSPQAAASAKPSSPAPSAAPSVAASATPQASASPKITSVAGPGSEIHGQPAAAANPPGARPGTQPNPNAPPVASPGGSAKPTTQSAPGASASPAASAKPATQPSPAASPGASVAKPTPSPSPTVAKTPEDSGHAR